MGDKKGNCRFCNKPLQHIFADLGMSPMSNSYLKKEELNDIESFFPLKAYVCSNCFLVQLGEFVTPEKIFSNYQYFSSYSDSFLAHAQDYTNMIIERFGFGEDSFVAEVASNDGYLLKNFIEKDIPVLGIEPAKNVAETAKEKGIPTITRFFNKNLAEELRNKGKTADLVIANNVLAHVPELNSFIKGLQILLNPDGLITVEFPHLMKLIENHEFDTIYHEHFSYFSFLTVERIFSHHGLRIFDVEELSIHGGSLRIYAKHEGNPVKGQITERVKSLRDCEKKKGYHKLATYTNFNKEVKQAKRDILSFLIEAKRQNKQIVGYGAPAKGNTLLNYCGIRSDFIDYTVDRNPHKQGYYLPGTHIPIYKPEKIAETKPDYILILPWNLKDEIISQLSYVREWGSKFITLIPEVTIHK